MQANLFGLWDHQDAAVTEIESSWRMVQSVCVQLPTGSGKTRVIRTIVDNHKSNKVIYIIAHRRQLVKQLSEELTEAKIRHGIIASGQPRISYRVQVCSLGTLVNRLEKLPEPEIIIIDEAHHIRASSYAKIINRWHEAKILGVTATPSRMDGKGLKDIFDRLIIGPSVRELIDCGILSDYEYYAPDTVDTTGMHMRAGEFVNKEVLERVNKRAITGCAVEHYEKYAKGLPAIACCASVAHADAVALQFKEAGYRAEAVHSKLGDDDVQEKINGLKNGTLDVLSQCEMIGEGVDIKGVVALIMLRPTASIVVFLQQIGRALRVAPGKEKAIILDHVGNWERHGLPDDEREWTLEPSKKKKKTEEATLKRCPDCLRPVAIQTRQCPYCEYIWKHEPASMIPESKAGKLVNIKDRRKRGSLVLEIARRANTLKQAIKVAEEHGATHKQAWYIWTKELRNDVS